jgi:hypothetical protein
MSKQISLWCNLRVRVASCPHGPQIQIERVAVTVWDAKRDLAEGLTGISVRLRIHIFRTIGK